MSSSLNQVSTRSRLHSGVWHRLHSEREDISEALLRETSSSDLGLGATANRETVKTWHRELLEDRLRKIDNALDRLSSGAYGGCSKCGRWIEDTKLEFDPAIAFCLACWDRMQQH